MARAPHVSWPWNDLPSKNSGNNAWAHYRIATRPRLVLLFFNICFLFSLEENMNPLITGIGYSRAFDPNKLADLSSKGIVEELAAEFVFVIVRGFSPKSTDPESSIQWILSSLFHKKSNFHLQKRLHFTSVTGTAFIVSAYMAVSLYVGWTSP